MSVSLISDNFRCKILMLFYFLILRDLNIVTFNVYLYLFLDVLLYLYIVRFF